jgi:hypothetical protein
MLNIENLGKQYNLFGGIDIIDMNDDNKVVVNMENGYEKDTEKIPQEAQRFCTCPQ